MNREELEQKINEYEEQNNSEKKLATIIDFASKGFLIGAVSMGAITLIGMSSFAMLCFSAGGFACVFNKFFQKQSKTKQKINNAKKKSYEKRMEEGLDASEEGKAKRRNRLNKIRKEKKKRKKIVDKYRKVFLGGITGAIPLALTCLVEPIAILGVAGMLGMSYCASEIYMNENDKLEALNYYEEKVLEEMNELNEIEEEDLKELTQEENLEEESTISKEKDGEEPITEESKEEEIPPTKTYFGHTADELLNSEIGKILLGGRDISEFSQKHKESFADKIMKEIEGIVNKMEQEPDAPKENSQGK